MHARIVQAYDELIAAWGEFGRPFGSWYYPRSMAGALIEERRKVIKRFGAIPQATGSGQTPPINTENTGE
jgi:hypothetical protein